MKYLIKIIVMSLILTIFSVLNLSIQSNVSANQLTFSVEPILPSNQVDSKVGFFNIKLNQGQSQDLFLKYTNNTKKTITVSANVASAKTNTNGVVDYNDSKIKNDVSLKYDLSNLVEIPKAVVLDAGQSKDVNVHVKMPNEAFRGIIAGGLTFNDSAKDKQDQSSKSSGLSIKNIYSFQIGLLMRQTTSSAYTDAQIQDNGLKLNQVTAGQQNYRNVVYANLQNPLSVYVNQMVVNAQITRRGSSAVLYSAIKGGMQMAPNTNFDFPITLGNGVKMKPGNYHLKLVAYSLNDNKGLFKTNIINDKIQSFKYRWVFEKNFTISGQESRQYNKSDVTIKKNNGLLWILLCAIILLLVALLLLILLLKHRRDDQEVDIEEEVRDLNNELTTIIRTVTMKEYKKLIKSGKRVRIIEDE